MVKNVNVQNSDNMLADLFVCATSSSSVEGNVRVHMLVCAPLSSFDASKTPANWQCGRHSCKGDWTALREMPLAEQGKG
jgi:hypothetical protein